MIKAIGKELMNYASHNKFNIGTGLYFGYDTYSEDKNQGHGTAYSLADAALETALPMMVGMPMYLGYELLANGGEMLTQGYDSMEKWSRQVAREQSNRAFASSRFNDTEQGYTMRQRGMAIAQRSKYNMEQAMMGNEAKYMMR